MTEVWLATKICPFSRGDGAPCSRTTAHHDITALGQVRGGSWWEGWLHCVCVRKNVSKRTERAGEGPDGVLVEARAESGEEGRHTS
jgi:hypothetical protein